MLILVPISHLLEELKHCAKLDVVFVFVFVFFRYFEQVLMLMRNLSVNLMSPEFEDHVSCLVQPVLHLSYLQFFSYHD